MTVTTARILADKALLRTCGQECVDWAISMLEQGREGHFLGMLAGMNPPFSHFEVSEYRDRSLRELGFMDVSESEAISIYTAELLRRALAGETKFAFALGVIKDFYIACDDRDDLYDFYLLHHAYSDLQESVVQWYWKDATRENIDSIIREHAEHFLQTHRV